MNNTFQIITIKNGFEFNFLVRARKLEKYDKRCIVI